MRRLFAAAFALVSLGMPVMSAQEERDEVSVSVNKVEIDIPVYSNISGWGSNNIEIGNLCLGPLVSNSKAPFDFDTEGSTDLLVFSTTPVVCIDNFMMSVGGGVEWRTLALTGNSAMIKGADGRIFTGPYLPGAVPKKSRLRVFSLNLPVLFSFEVFDAVGVTFGPVFDFNVDSNIKNKYRLDGDKCKDKYKHVHSNVFNVDVLMELNVFGISFFAKYSPMSLMDKSYWPEFQTWSFGIAL